MRRSFRILLMIIIFFLPTYISASASLTDHLVPIPGYSDGKRYIGEVKLFYNEYPTNRYRLETYVDTSDDWKPWNWGDGVEHSFYLQLMEMVNTIWTYNIIFSSFIIKVVQEAFKLNFISDVIDIIGEAVQNIAGFGPGGFTKQGIWPLLLTFILTLTGTWAAYVGMIKRESSRAWGGLLSTLIIFVFALGFFSNTGKILGGLNDWSSNLQSEVLAISASIVDPEASYNKEEAIATIHNQLFDLMVKKPYLLMQYGTTDVDKDRVKKLLKLRPNDESRHTLVKDEADGKKEITGGKKNEMMSLGGVTERLGFIPLLLLSNAIIGLILLIVSGSIILYQMFFITLALFSPVPLLMALMPRWQQAGIGWLMKLLHTQIMKIGISLFLTILFGISAILYRATESSKLGYIWMMTIQIICFVGLIIKRRDFFNIVSTATNNIQSNSGHALQNSLRKYYQMKTVGNLGGVLTGRNKWKSPAPLANRRSKGDYNGNRRSKPYVKKDYYGNRISPQGQNSTDDLKPYIQQGNRQSKETNAHVKEKDPLHGVDRNGKNEENMDRTDDKELNINENKLPKLSVVKDDFQSFGRYNSAQVEDRTAGPLPDHLLKDTDDIKQHVNHKETDLARRQSRYYMERRNREHIEKNRNTSPNNHVKGTDDLQNSDRKSSGFNGTLMNNTDQTRTSRKNSN
ncbi:CD3337/EF1877 family mobilome membrane protein [Alkalihalobacillus sp. TS-13]|uniref:CD3337/EF1877 family mobilome membrane protein n=1 Tax=Alkalihalobacillus sp. TS-13 TaxID=2842455 RepID=UPI001C8873B2|nr:conjugal transfer protein [Alkalihalobacillus sp. TS-13]